MRYAPILKARKAELEALHTQQIDCHVEPIFEIQHDDWDPVGSGKSIATDAASFLDKIRRQWLRPCFVDLIRIAHTQADREAWWRYLDASLALPGTPRPTLAPVLTTGDGPNVLAAAEPLAQAAGKALVRIPAPCSDLSGLAHFLSICAQSLNLQSHRVELLIDWADSTEDYSLNDLEQMTQLIIAAIPESTPVIVAGTPNTSQCQNAGQWDFDRREWWLWLRLNAQERSVTFGDYALFPPPNPGRGRVRYGHLRYSHGDTLHVERQGGRGAADGFVDCCGNIRTLGILMNPSYSVGDQTIHGILARTVKAPGTGDKWRTIALQHHLRLVCNQLSQPLTPPPPGTP